MIGGLGAFFITVQRPEEFARAIRRKLILEIAGKVPATRLVLAQQTEPAESFDCLIGEKLWQTWMGGSE